MNGADQTYRFGTFALESQKRLLYEGSELIPLPPKVAQTLLILVENHGKVVDKELLLSSIWPDAFVEEGNLHHNVSVLRKLLQSNGAAARIDTLPKRGYRFVGEVTVVDNGGTEPPRALPELPPAVARRPRTLYVAAGFVVLCAILTAAFLLGPRITLGTERNGAVPVNSIAVLPFSNFSSDAEADYLGDALADEVIHLLTRVPGLRVVARTSSFQFKGKSVDLRHVGAQLQARLVLEGSVQKDGNRLRVTAQLIDAATGLHLWSEQFDRQFGDVFAIQDEICRAIAGTLSVQLSGPAGSERRAKQAANLEVYTLYLRGMNEWNRRDRAGVKAGREFFERALALDATYAPAWAGLSDTLVHSGLWGMVPPNEAFPRAKAAALRAIELDGRLASPHTALAYVQGWYERSPEAAEASFRRALDLSPGYSWGRQQLASYLSVLGRHEEAIREFRQTLQLDPISPSANSGLALAFFWARQYDRAIEQCAKAREMDPKFPLTYYYLAHALEQKHRYEEAILALEEGIRIWGSTDGVMLTELYAATPGRRKEALARLQEIRNEPGGGSSSPYHLALIYGALGDREAALSWLDRSSRDGDVWFLYANVDPRLDNLRSDRRFQQLLRRRGHS